jgi:group I intron endonuclease
MFIKGYISGIYKITCLSTGKFYIGSSTNINRRLKQHMGLLKHNKHENKYMQNAWNKHGEENFKFEIIETIRKTRELLTREQRWLDATQCYKKAIGFNISSDVNAVGIGRFIDITGQKFNRLTAIKYMGESKWLCKCDCKKEIIVNGDALKSGNTKSCGCLKLEMLKSRNKGYYKNSRAYNIWCAIKQRCNYKKHKYYKNYGGRITPITICKRWSGKNGFKNFLKDMGEPPTNKHQINRINNDKGYNKKNCNWVLPKINSRNKTNNRMITYNGKTQCLSSWAEELGINQRILWDRIYRYKWSIEKAFNTPVQRRINNV